MFVLDVAFNLATTIGNLSVAYIIKDVCFNWALFISALFFSISLLYAICVIKETVNVSEPAKFFTIDHVKRSLLLYIRDNNTNRRWKLQVNTLNLNSDSYRITRKKIRFDNCEFLSSLTISLLNQLTFAQSLFGE